MISNKKVEIVPLSMKALDMKVGQQGWIRCDDIAIIERPNLLPKQYERVINLKGNVHPMPHSYGSVKIKRIGKDTLGEDFELDFSNCSGAFDILDAPPFTMNTTPTLVQPDFVTEQTVKMYWQIDELYDELRESFDVEQYLVSAKPIQEILKVMVDKMYREFENSSIIKLLNKYFDNCTVIAKTNDFIKSEIDEADSEDDYNEDIEYAHAEIQLAEALNKNLMIILREKIPMEYLQYNDKRRQTIFEKISGNEILTAELEQTLLETIKNNN